MALVDMSATHNIVSKEKANKLSLKVNKGKRWTKVVNSEAKPIKGLLIRCATITIEDWLGPAEMIVVEFYDHPIILSMDFLRKS